MVMVMVMVMIRGERPSHVLLISVLELRWSAVLEGICVGFPFFPVSSVDRLAIYQKLDVCLISRLDPAVLVFFVVTSLILDASVEDVVLGDSENQEEPEDIDGLEAGQQRKGDDLAEQAFVLLRLPVELVWSHSLELGQDCVEDAEIDIVSQVDPDPNKHAKIWTDYDRVYIVKGFGGLGSN
jgi:hypothetical protein